MDCLTPLPKKIENRPYQRALVSTITPTKTGYIETASPMIVQRLMTLFEPPEFQKQITSGLVSGEVTRHPKEPILTLDSPTSSQIQ